MQWQNHLESTPSVLFGKLIIKKTRVPVELILEKLAALQSFDDLLLAYPQITIEDIQACLLYAADNARHEKIMAVA